MKIYLYFVYYITHGSPFSLKIVFRMILFFYD